MANPQIENGYTKIANEILEHLMKMPLSPNQWQVLLCIIRKTYGFQKKVDYISNSQIVEDTGLCKSVVSRCLQKLNHGNLIFRKGKYIGFQKDWEKWKLAEQSTIGKLAEQSTLDAKLAEQLTALDNKSKQNSQPELAEQSTKVSSPRVTQKKKETIQKKETVSERFDAFGETYPKKRNKGQAEKAFKKLNPNDDLLAAMVTAIEKARRCRDWQRENGRFIPYPATWLNARGWEDELDEKSERWRPPGKLPTSEELERGWQR